MSAVAGLYYDGNSARALPAQLDVAASGDVRLILSAQEAIFPLAQLRVGARVGNSARSIYFPDGAKFETRDNDAVDRAFAAFDIDTSARVLHKLETHTRYILVAIAIAVVTSWAAVKFGIPAAAKSVAFALPAKTNSLIGQGTLTVLDKMFSASALDAATQEKFRAYFTAMSAPVAEPGVEYRLLFRKGGKIGANAFALPSGTVIVTDELIALAEHDQEVVAVLAHEIGHVKNRHGLRHAIQSSTVALVALAITGDVSSTSYAIAALPTLLVDAQYSQNFEREADAYSLQYLRANRIERTHFKNFMLRLEAEHGGSSEWAHYLASHPPTQERIAAFND